jgi:hypothetical protein
MAKVGVGDLPFLKRLPYKDKHEFRIVYTDRNHAIEYKDYKIALGWIYRITLSPWMSQTLVNSVKKTLRTIDRCVRLKVVRSTLINNDSWKAITGRL